jgi:hypothetical protein
MVRWRKLNIDLEEAVRLLASHSAKTFHDEDGKIRIEATLMGDPCMVILPYNDEAEKKKIIDRLLGEGFLWTEIVVEPDL